MGLEEDFYFHGLLFGTGGLVKVYLRAWDGLTLYMSGDLRDAFGRSYPNRERRRSPYIVV